MKLKTLFLFLLLGFTLQLHAQCTNYAGADPIAFDSEICPGASIGFDIFIFTNDAPIGEFYDIQVTGSDGSVGFGFGFDDGFGFGDLLPNPVEGCEPAEVFVDFTILCGDTGEVLEVINQGPFLVYPELIVDIVPPGCNEGENGSATLIAANGEICEGPIEGTAGVEGDCETQEPGTLAYEFTVSSGTFCEQFFADDIEIPCSELASGCTDETACNYDPEAVCDDGSCIAEPCCPQPLPETFPAAVCADNFGTEYCITFDGDISEIDEFSIFIDGLNVFGFFSSTNPDENQICILIDAFPAEFCMISNETFNLSYFCPNIGQDVFIQDIPIAVYPSPFDYEVFSEPSGECGGVPDILPPFCGELFIGNIVEPINDCENPVAGVVPYDIDPGFDLTGAPECFTALLAGEVPIPPCLEDCPCDGTFCNGICVDLTATATNFPTSVCSDYGFDFQLDITGLGADIADYFILINDNTGNNVGFEFHNSGDPTTYFPFVFPFAPQCTPEDQTFTYEIECVADGTILAAGTLGTVTVYPSPFNFFPNITPSIACQQDLMITAICGTVILDPDPIPTPGCGGEDTEVNWSVDFGFDYPPECGAFPIEGTEPVFACAGTPGDPCDDGSLCTTNDVLDEDCNCVGEGPTLTLDSEIPTAACADEPFIITASIDIDPGPDGIFIVVNDQFGNFPGFVQIFPGDPLTIDIEVFLFADNPCNISSIDLVLQLFCPIDFTPIGASIPLGTITVYPSPFNYEVFSQPSGECGGTPELFPPNCGDLVIGNITAPINDCDNPVAGVVPYDIDPGFDLVGAPDCFTALLAGEVPIPPCLEDCPCDGTFCNGICVDLMVTATDFPTAVCPDNGFDFQLDVMGLGADFGDYFILINDSNGNNLGFEFHAPGDPTTYFPFIFPFVNGCTPEDQEFSYEIECPTDGTILATGTLGTATVYPSSFNFFPNITPSIACVQELVIESFCGTVILDPDPIPVPGCGGADTEVNWSVDFGFDYPAECAPAPIEGTETVFACAGTPGDPCDDNNPCTSNDVLDADCNCTGEGSTVSLDSALPTAICADDILTVTVTVDMEPGPDGIFVIVNDQFDNFPGGAFIFPGDPLTFDIDAFFFTNGPCDIPSYDLTLELFCGFNFEPITAPVSIGTVTVYSPPDVENAAGDACTDVVTDNCGNSTILYSTDGFATPGTATPPTLNPGDADVTVSWTAAVTGAPANCEIATGTYTLTCEDIEPPACAIQAAIVDSMCDDGGDDDPTNDIITFTVAVTDNGNGSATGWTDDQAAPQTGTYGNTATYTVMANSSVTITYTDATDMACTTSVTLTATDCATADVVPTVGEWGLIILGLLMSIVAIVGIRQREMTIAYEEIEK